MRRIFWSNRLPWSRRPLDPISTRKPRANRSNGSVHKPRQPKPVLAAEPSAALRDQLLAEIAGLNHSDDLALWAHRRLPAKNTLAAEDAHAIEAAYQAALNTFAEAVDRETEPGDAEERRGTPLHRGYPSGDAARTAEVEAKRPSAVPPGAPFKKPVRARNKAHLAICGSPALPGLSALALRCPSSEVCPTPVARQKGQ